MLQSMIRLRIGRPSPVHISSNLYIYIRVSRRQILCQMPQNMENAHKKLIIRSQFRSNLVLFKNNYPNNILTERDEFFDIGNTQLHWLRIGLLFEDMYNVKSLLFNCLLYVRRHAKMRLFYRTLILFFSLYLINEVHIFSFNLMSKPW